MPLVVKRFFLSPRPTPHSPLPTPLTPNPQPPTPPSRCGGRWHRCTRQGASTLSGAALGKDEGNNRTGAVSNKPSTHVGGGDGGVAGAGAGGEAGAVTSSMICARLSLDDWRINLIEVGGGMYGEIGEGGGDAVCWCLLY